MISLLCSESDWWFSTRRVSWILHRSERAGSCSRSWTILLRRILILILWHVCWVVISILLPLILHSIVLVLTIWCILSIELIVLKELLRRFLVLLPIIIFSLFWLILFLGSLIFFLSLATSAAPLDLATFLTWSITSIVSISTLIPKHVLIILRLLKWFLFLFLKVSVSHWRCFLWHHIALGFFWKGLLLASFPFISIIAKTSLFPRVPRIFLWSSSITLKCSIIFVIVLTLIISKCDVRFILRACSLMECFINIIIASEWLTHTWLTDGKSIILTHLLSSLSKGEITLSSWIIKDPWWGFGIYSSELLVGLTFITCCILFISPALTFRFLIEIHF